MAKKNNRNVDYKPEDILFPEQTIVSSELVQEMKTSYIDYAMSVIVGRALPDVRDGFKPVHRRILYAMYEDGLTHDKAFRKCATAVGDVLGRYHPHGDASVYDALVRMAQDFSMRYPLIEGHGNFGSVDGDPPAAYRYTEARMSRLSNEMLRDIEKETVDFIPNFDETRREPLVVPSRFPNLLVNGSSGIAVGMATNIPPHNLTEVINAALCILENPEATLDDLMQHIQGPDFPTHGIIVGRSGIRQAYATGRGHIRVRARTEFETFAQNRTRIIITELPYQVNKRQLIAAIAEQVKEKRLEGISDIRDETDDRGGMRVVIELKHDANPQIVLNHLLDQTQLQITFAVNMLALVNNQTQPRILSLRHILDEYLAFQQEVLVRRTKYDLKKALDRMHLLQGLLIAHANIDEVVRIIRESYDDAKERLMAAFRLSEIQAQAILDMRLKQLQKLDHEKLQSEYDELEKAVAYYRELLADPEKIRGVLRDELSELRDRYGDERLTEITDAEDDIEDEDLIEEKLCCFTLSEHGYITRLAADVYRSQHRGGRGVSGQTLKEEDWIKSIFVASSHDLVLFLTNQGRVISRKGYRIPEASRTAKGTPAVNILPLKPEEKISTMVMTHGFPEDEYLMMVTRMGTVKRLRLSQLDTVRSTGIRALTLDEGDELVSAFRTTGADRVVLATKRGMAICFDETDVRPMGRDAGGVRGITLSEGDAVVGAELYAEGMQLLTVTEYGFGKRTPLEDYLRTGENGVRTTQSRGGKGLRNYSLSAQTGSVAAIRVVSGDEDVLLIADGGTVIRTAVADINVYKRDTKGVRVMRTEEERRIIAIEKVEASDGTDEGEAVQEEN